ncbi:DUF2330 domain-containing protein [Saxibacter everestensis]|uniref:DUF2330 domain-containing protein n=1 Tax=Saxibacter everestensis TaxID=2909229 RepID=A0ABY8QW14_9MICO|nr:DUF2330 domain-containing protein [Brevibacteriaceae bacterium ZFBP1038]
MTPRRFPRSLLIACVMLGILSSGSIAPAAACACGVAIPPAQTKIAVDAERAILHYDGTQETIMMRLTMASDGAETALVVPTPQPATVTAGSKDAFDELDAMAEPKVVGRKKWWPEAGDGVGSAPMESAPKVLDTVRLGPLQATTLAADDAAGLRRWLQDNRYPLDPAVAEGLDEYVADGWAFVAMKISADAALDGEIDPVVLTFSSDQLVYPMRLSKAAKVDQRVRNYVIAEHRVDREDAEMGTGVYGEPTVAWAGTVDAGSVHDAQLKKLVGETAFVTVIDTAYNDPAEQITDDYRYVQAPRDEPYQVVNYVDEPVKILGVYAGPFLTGLGVLLVITIVVVIAARLLGRRHRAT